MSSNIKHRIEYCNTCLTNFIRCGYCGNNCCNAGTGKLEDGSKCGCEEAYKIQEEMWQAESTQ